jgi:hypothetical protein
MTTPAKTLFGKANNTDAGYNIAFWFAVLSPALGVLLGFLALLLLVH